MPTDEPHAPKYHVEGEQIRGSAIGDYATVYNIILQQYPALGDYTYDFSQIIEDASQGFVGRQFVFDRVDEFIQRHSSGYLRIVADAGLGKTAIAAQLIKRYNAVPYFFNASIGLTSADKCLNHLCAQLIARYTLPHDHLPEQAGTDAAFLLTLLNKASQKRIGGQPVVLVIDALDEADASGDGRNWLHLPDRLPEGVYVVLVHRPGNYLVSTRPGTPVEQLSILWNEPNQQNDIELYLQQQAQCEDIRQVLAVASPSITTEHFVTALKQASQGNFMYLHYVLEDIIARKPTYNPLDLDTLPQGLEGYYEQFWAHIKQIKEAEGKQEWKTFYRPLITVLGVAREPVTTEWLAAHTHRAQEDVHDALQTWQRFLSQQRQNATTSWRIVHQSFADFLKEKVNLVVAHQRVATYYQSASARWTIHKGYAVRHLTTHLRLAGEYEMLFALVDNRSWYEAQMEQDSSGVAYLTDLTQTWIASEAVNGEAIRRGQVPSLLRREVQCALATASSHSRSQTVPPELLKALVNTGLWTPIQALAVARQTADKEGKAELLLDVALHLPEAERLPVLREALEVARAMELEYWRPKAMAAVAEYLPEAERLPVLREALVMASEAGYWDWQAKALKNVAPYLPEHLLGEALLVARAIEDEYWQAKALIALAPRLPEEMKNEVLYEALRIVRTVESKSKRAWMLITITSHLSGVGDSDVLEDTLTTARAVEDNDEQAAMLADLASQVPESQKGPLLREALDTARAIEAEVQRVARLVKLSSYLADTNQDEVLQEALAIARTTDDQEQRVRALAAVVSYLPQAERLSILQEVIQVDRAIPEAELPGLVLWQRVERLAKEGYPQEALDAARTIEQTRYRVKTLTSVASYLPAPLKGKVLLEALDTGRMIKDLPEQVKALTELALHLSNPLQREFLIKALHTAQAIEGDSERVKVLAEIMPHLPQPFRSEMLNEVLQNAHTIEDPHRRVQMLVPLLAKDECVVVLPKALEVARTIGDPHFRAWALEELVPHLTEPLRGEVLREALAATRLIEHESLRAQVLGKLASYLSEDLLHEALNSARALEDEYWRCVTLLPIALQLPRVKQLPILREALDLALAIDPDEQFIFGSPQGVALAWTALGFAEVGSPQQALEIARTIQSARERAEALGGIAPHLPQPLKDEVLHEALDVAQTILNEGERVKALATVVPHLPQTECLQVLRTVLAAGQALETRWIGPLAQMTLCLAEVASPGEALEVALVLTRADEQTRVLKVLAPQLAQLSPASLYPLWRKTLSILAAQTRKDLLANLSALAPVMATLGGENAVTETARAVVEIGRWWP